MQNTDKNTLFTNKLIQSGSPYLLQHAHNPVFWYPWGEEAFARAKVEDKPILLSSGYSTCYWCHVMNREVFENPSIASYMNEHFINIKLDREEFPEIDEFYMVARQVLMQEGGWPNNVFLTPDLRPFFAGGTFGPADSGKRPGFPRLLEGIWKSWQQDREELERQANELTSITKSILYQSNNNESLSNEEDLSSQLIEYISQSFDESAGGFSLAPKFPHETYMRFLLQEAALTGNHRALDMVTLTLYKMAAGGIYDHVGCGFHRYAVDKEWYIPHFEKMLYNQAQLALCYAEHFRQTGDSYTKMIARSILDACLGAFSSHEGLFYSAFDAETNGVEGAYYAWTENEIVEFLGPEDAEFFVHYYALAEIPHFPGHKKPAGKAIVARMPLPQAAAKEGFALPVLMARSGLIFNKLLEVRNRRVSPARDDKLILGWNGMMIEAYAFCGEIFFNNKYIDRAIHAAHAIFNLYYSSQRGFGRIRINATTYLAAQLEDYAYLLRGILALARITGDKIWLERAKLLFLEADKYFSDPAGGYFHTREDDKPWLRIKHSHDGALPSANAVMAHNFLDMHALSPQGGWLEQAERLISSFTGAIDARALPQYATLIAAITRFNLFSKPQTPILETKSPILILSAAIFPPHAKAEEVAEIIISVEIADGWHIYAHASSHDSALSLSPSVVFIEGKGIKEVLRIDYPAPHQKTFALQEEKVAVFEGLVTFSAHVRLSDAYTANGHSITIKLHYQACSVISCDSPAQTAVII